MAQGRNKDNWGCVLTCSEVLSFHSVSLVVKKNFPVCWPKQCMGLIRSSLVEVRQTDSMSSVCWQANHVLSSRHTHGSYAAHRFFNYSAAMLQRWRHTELCCSQSHTWAPMRLHIKTWLGSIGRGHSLILLVQIIPQHRLIIGIISPDLCWQL